MEEASEDLYADLDASNDNAEIRRLQEALKKSTDLNGTLQSTVEDLTSQLRLVVEEKDVIENNLVSIYNTALRELARRDKQIVALQAGGHR